MIFMIANFIICVFLFTLFLKDLLYTNRKNLEYLNKYYVLLKEHKDLQLEISSLQNKIEDFIKKEKLIKEILFNEKVNN